MQQNQRTGIPSTLMAIPDGPAGTYATLKIMSRIVNRYKSSVPLRELALNIIRDVPGSKNFAGQAERLQNYVRYQIQYVKDITGIETVQTPDRTLQNRAGDCDDQAVLLATLLESVGHPTRFVAIKLRPFAPYVHVFTETKVKGGWLAAETTEDWPLGQQPPKFFKRMVVNN